jgi:hypothetical protein
MIYFTLFTTVYLVVFTILFIRDTVVNPILKLTDLITKPDKHNEDTQKKFVKMVKIIEMRKKNISNKNDKLIRHRKKKHQKSQRFNQNLVMQNRINALHDSNIGYTAPVIKEDYINEMDELRLLFC